jgi:hypothetical protein
MLSPDQGLTSRRAPGGRLLSLCLHPPKLPHPRSLRARNGEGYRLWPRILTLKTDRKNEPNSTTNPRAISIIDATAHFGPLG